MKKTYKIIILLITIAALVGLKLVDFTRPVEVNVEYLVNLTDDMISFDSALEKVQANLSIQYDDIRKVGGCLKQFSDNVTTWEIGVERHRRNENYATHYIMYLDAFSGDILGGSGTMVAITYGSPSTIEYASVIILAVIAIILVYDLVLRERI